LLGFDLLCLLGQLRLLYLGEVLVDDGTDVGDDGRQGTVGWSSLLLFAEVRDEVLYLFKDLELHWLIDEGPMHERWQRGQKQ